MFREGYSCPQMWLTRKSGIEMFDTALRLEIHRAGCSPFPYYLLILMKSQ